MFKKGLLLAVVLVAALQVNASGSDSAMINQLVREIAQEQVVNKGDFLSGMIYSYRKFAGYPQRYTDDENIFFTAVTAFALRNMSPYLSESNREISKSIIEKAVSTYPYFQNRNKQPTYYFWQHGYPIMPHSYWASRSGKKLAVSVDVDDTVMILMTMGATDSTLKLLKRIMDSASNGQRRLTNTTYKKYKKVPAHSTYPGRNMLVDFEFAVHCNVLYFLLDQKLEWNDKDTATLSLVKEMVRNREYITDPLYISPYYIHTPILLYHLCRLMGRFKIPELEPYKQQLINDIKKSLRTSTNIMDDIILSTSLLRLGGDAEALPIESIEQFNNSNQDQFVFYQARAAILFPNPLKRPLLHFSMFNYHYFSPTYNKVLLLEYLVERGKMREKQPQP